MQLRELAHSIELAAVLRPIGYSYYRTEATGFRSFKFKKYSSAKTGGAIHNLSQDPESTRRAYPDFKILLKFSYPVGRSLQEHLF